MAKRKVQKTTYTARERLILSAERLFAEKGYEGVSVREIADDAKANLSLVSYYFGGKEGLLAEIYTHYSQVLNGERARLLAIDRKNGRKPTLEEVLEAFIRPSLDGTHSGSRERGFLRLRAVLLVENSCLLEELVAHSFDRYTKLFVDALSECLPHLKKDDVFWLFHFLLGTIHYTATGPQRIKAITKGRCNTSDPEATLKELIPFLAAGFRSPAVQHLPNASNQPRQSSPERNVGRKRIT
jgi:AcrR family transcriptional regulator